MSEETKPQSVATFGRGDIAELTEKFIKSAQVDMEANRQRQLREPSRADAIQKHYSVIITRLPTGQYKAEVTDVLPAPMTELSATGHTPEVARKNLYWAFAMQLHQLKVVGSHEAALKAASEVEFTGYIV